MRGLLNLTHLLCQAPRSGIQTGILCFEALDDVPGSSQLRLDTPILFHDFVKGALHGFVSMGQLVHGLLPG